MYKHFFGVIPFCTSSLNKNGPAWLCEPEELWPIAKRLDSSELYEEAQRELKIYDKKRGARNLYKTE